MNNKILIIEDDQVVANIYRNKFSHAGFEVEVASDGKLGFELVRSFRPDAVVLDLMLPKMTGVELMKKIRSEPGFQQLPVVVFSNTYLTGMAQEVCNTAATKCVSKTNCTPKQVIDIIRGELSTNGTGTKSNSATPSQPAKDEDLEFQAELRKTFIEELPATLSGLRTALQAMIKAENEGARLKHTDELYRRVHALTANAGITGLIQITQMADALEALLKELYEKPKNITSSTLRTVASAIDFLGMLFDRGNLPDQQELPAANILVVDDEAISRRALTFALEKARLKSVNVESPVEALELLAQKPFDLIFLDVDMPAMNGFELCTKLRTLPAHKKTPVVFVTSLNDFDSRANSTMSGGSDFIAKPFLFIELAVKAMMYVLRSRLTATKP